MKNCIPFVNTPTEMKFRNKYHVDSGLIRIQLESVVKGRMLESDCENQWVDSGVDAYHHYLKDNCKDRIYDWGKYIQQVTDEHSLLKDSEQLKKPNKNKMKIFINNVLDKCLSYKPKWITLPQLPVVDGNERNKINRILAELSFEWKKSGKFTGKFVYPIIFTNQSQVKGRTQWRKTLELAKNCCQDFKETEIWATDESLADQDGTGTFDKRFKSLINFHTELRELSSCKIIAGPYWGMNLVLCVRNLCDYPAISLGASYQYRLSGGFKGRTGAIRVAIPPIRKWAKKDKQLQIWLSSAIKKLGHDKKSRSELEEIRSNYNILDGEQAKDQVVKFYRDWIDKTFGIPEEGRQLGLYQDLSSALVVGKQLPKLGNKEPGIVAQQLMLNCL